MTNTEGLPRYVSSKKPLENIQENLQRYLLPNFDCYS